jgi:hypothetical protein
MPIPNQNTTTKPIPITIKNSSSQPIAIPIRTKHPLSRSSSIDTDGGLGISRSRSNSLTSKAVHEIGKIKLERDKRRAKQSEIIKLKSDMDSSANKQYIYKQEIDKFRLKFAKSSATIRIRTNKSELDEFHPKIRVCVRKRPLNNKGTIF